MKTLKTRTVLSLAFGLRIAVLLYAVVHYPAGWFFGRGQEMGLLADALLHGRGLSSPFGPATGPTAIIAPGYPVLVAAIFGVFGSYTLRAALLLMSLNLTVNVLTIFLIMRFAQRLAGRRAAIAAGLLWACSPPLLWMPTIFWETSISCCVLLAMAILMIEGKGSARWAGAGILCALGGLVNPALLPSLLGMGALAAWRGGRTQWRSAIRGGILFVALFAAWPVRNARVFHAFIPMRTTVGLELWMGNHQDATGYLEQALFPTFNPGELQAYRTEGELAYTSGKGREARQWIELHPARFFWLTALRSVRFWTGTGTRGGSCIFAVHAVLTTLLGACGLWRLRGHRACMMLAVPLLLFPLPYCLTHAEFRYRLGIDPVLTVLAGCALGIRRAKDSAG